MPRSNDTASRTSRRRTTPPPGAVPWNALDVLAGIGACVLAVAVVRMPVLTPDVWWHLATGRLILTDGIPSTDPFAWSLAGAPWFLHAWLADALWMRVVDAGGLLGLVSLRSGLVVAAFIVAYVLARRHAGTLVSLLLLVPAAWASQRNWLDRPQLCTFVFLPVLVHLLETARLRGVGWRVFLAVPVLMLAWANLHGGFMVGLAVLVVWTVAVLLQARRGPTPSARARRWVVLVGVAVLATLVTPNGVDGLLYPLRYVGSDLSEGLIEERVGRLDSGYAWVHLTLVLLLAAAFVVRWRRLVWPHAVLGVLLAGMSLPRLAGLALPLAAERHAPLFLLVAVPILAWQLQGLVPWRPGAWSRRPTAWGGALVPLVVAVLLAARAWPRDGSPGARLLPGRYPVAATTWLQQNELPGRLINPYRWGAWLLFHLYPRYTVWIDSRGDLHGIERIREAELLHALPPGSETRVQDILDRDDVDVVVWHLLTLDFGPLQLSPLADWLLQSPDWRLVFWDRSDPRHPDHPAGTTGVFLRQHRRNEALLRQYPAARLPPLPGRRRDFGLPQRPAPSR